MLFRFTTILPVSLMVAALLPALVAHADSAAENAEANAAYYTITSVQTREIPAVQSQDGEALPAPRSSLYSQALGNPLSGISLSTIVNLGQKAWAIVQANAPVVNVTVNAANALPQGTTNWTQLSGWQAPVAKAYETSFVNGFGMTVVDFQYQVSYISGGSYEGMGEYLTNVTVQPLNVSVLWGYKFNAQVTIPSITNAGSLDSPMAAAEVVVQWTIDDVLKHQQQAQTYYVRGDGSFEALQ